MEGQVQRCIALCAAWKSPDAVACIVVCFLFAAHSMDLERELLQVFFSLSRDVHLHGTLQCNGLSHGEVSRVLNSG